MRIRQIRETDAEAYLNLKRRLDYETSFMLFEPGERKESVEKTRNGIREMLSRDHHLIWVAEGPEGLVGYVEAVRGCVRRNRHSAYLVAGILQAWTGKGLGTKMFTVMEEWARQKGIHRLELTVMTHNRAGIALYRKMGFEVEGVKRHSLRVAGEYVDEYLMAKLL
jgi:RimJ/RimL family protein N-acetyltransferase